MVVSHKDNSTYCFGVFEFDLRAAELRKNRVKVKLQDQPYQVLLKLLQHPGEIVSREELRSALWQENTFVDFETGLNTAVRRLRETLGDSPDNPIFIETLPRRGYKFIAPVERRVTEDRAIPVAVGRQERRRGKDLLKRGSAVTAVAAVLISGVVWYRQPRPPTVANVVRISNDRQSKIAMNLPVTDGVHLYFVEGAPWTTGSGIAQMSAAGGETTRIATTLPKVLAIYDISPDRSQLLVASGVADSADPATGRAELASEVWVQPLPAGTPHRVGNIYATHASWTPDGLHIVYADGQGIMRVNKDGSERQQLAKVPTTVHGLRFSPDGRRIRFQMLPGVGFDSSTIWEMDADGKNLHQLFSGWNEAPFQCCGNWSPDGNYYYFEARTGNNQGIWVLPEGHFFFSRARQRPSRLISGPLRFSVPVPSGDGKRLFVVGDDVRVELLRYDSRTGTFDSYLQGISAGPFDFSPDRQWITYVSYPDMVLWRSRADGSEKLQLTFPPIRAYQPRWSPDGSRIVFLDVAFSHPWRIRLLSASGGSSEVLVPADGDEDQADPTWMPDGKSIVFSASKAADKRAIYRLDLSSRKPELIPGSGGIFSPRVSPDGRHISALASGQRKLMVFDISTSRWSILAEGQQLSMNEWSHDGKYVYVRESADAGPKLVRIRQSDRRWEHVLSLKDFPQVVDIFAAWVSLTPDDAPVLMRDRSVQEIYALDLTFR